MSFTWDKKEEEMIERFAEGSIKNADKPIEDFGSFKDAFFNYMGLQTKGNFISSNFSEGDFKKVFESNVIRNEVEKNIGEKNADEMYADVERTSLSITRTKPVGERITRRQVKATILPKAVKVKAYTTKVGKAKGEYYKGKPIRWTNSQINFLKGQKTKKLTSKQIAINYNREYPQTPRSFSSISTKVTRVAKGKTFSQ